MAIIFAIGIKASFRVTKISDFVLADRKLSGLITAFGAGASDMSGWLLMALPGYIFTFGANRIWMPLSLITGAYINWQFVAKRLRVYTEVAGNALTVPSYLSNRFFENAVQVRLVTSLVIIVFFTAYASASFVMCAKTAGKLFSISYLHALIISAIIMTSYTCLGGFLAVNWIDLFQGSLMFIALIIVPSVVIYHLDGFEATIGSLSLIPEYWSLYLEPSQLISDIGWGLGYFGQVHVLTRFMAIRNHQELPLAKNICMPWMILSMLGAICCGLVGRAHYYDLPDPEMVFINLAIDLFTPWMAGVLIAAVLSAIMSSITAYILNASSTLVEDFYRKKFRKNATENELLWVARGGVLVISIISVIFALEPRKTILALVEFAWSGIGASFGPVILVSLYWKNMTSKAAVYGMAIGASCVLAWSYLHDVHYLFQIDGMFPGFILNLVTIYLISRYGNSVDKKMLKDFETTQNILSSQ
ncbi:MAG: sodium/proline symporter [Legionellales bacterium]|nr:sodium/proline symporter [Legionellales bacterium]